jgi:hypothetical protein
MDLASGEEVKILSDVPHSAASTIKIPIMINLFREELLITQEEAYLLTESILCSNNSSSNFLIQLAGDGDYQEAQLRDGLNGYHTAQEWARHIPISVRRAGKDRTMS